MRRAVICPALLALATLLLAGCTTSGGTAPSRSAVAVSTTAPTHPPLPSSTFIQPVTAEPSPTHVSASPTAAEPTITAPTSTAPTSAAPINTASTRLPLTLSTGSATRVITVVAASTRSTTATLQAWQRSGTGWLRYGPSIQAHLGSAGLTYHPSESVSATPIGSFTLTRAFGRDSNPGTSLPYLQTSPADWWISQYGGRYAGCYNTLQTAAPSATCPYTEGNPNEHLYYETPYYDYAVVMDVNTANAPGGVVQGGGSAFFLHVTDGTPTAGCVSIPMSSLVTIMKWLAPAAHPRILIGLAS